MMSKWMFAATTLCEESPSRQVGISFETENRRRSLGIHIIREASRALALDVEVMGSAFMYFHRYFCIHAIREDVIWTVAAACVFLASKSRGDMPRKLGDVVTVFYQLRRPSNTLDQVLSIGEEYWKRKDLLTTTERSLLTSLLFDLEAETPYRYILSNVFVLGEGNNLAQLAWSLCTNSFLETFCLQYSAAVIAVGCIQAAADLLHIQLPMRYETPWYEAMGVESEEALRHLARIIRTSFDRWENTSQSLLDEILELPELSNAPQETL